MEFKIDTKENYTLIGCPAAPLNGEMAEQLLNLGTAQDHIGSSDLIVDLSACQSAELGAMDALAALHEACYTQGRSLIFAGLPFAALRIFSESGGAEVLNLAPTLAEAVDMVSMEKLERELMEGE